VINVAGHRLGTKELESATIEVEEAEAAAVPVVAGVPQMVDAHKGRKHP
jgi:acyl-coenzyme A synthetase/AMP-(fatty) acid ligase